MNAAHYPSLAGRAVLVTGGASGIGESLVEHFWKQDARVAFVDIDGAASSALVERLSASRLLPLAFQCEVRDISAPRPVPSAFAPARLGKVDWPR